MCAHLRLFERSARLRDWASQSFAWDQAESETNLWSLTSSAGGKREVAVTRPCNREREREREETKEGAKKRELATVAWASLPPVAAAFQEKHRSKQPFSVVFYHQYIYIYISQRNISFIKVFESVGILCLPLGAKRHQGVKGRSSEGTLGEIWQQIIDPAAAWTNRVSFSSDGKRRLEVRKDFTHSRWLLM